MVRSFSSSSFSSHTFSFTIYCNSIMDIEMKRKLFGRNMSDTAFSVERLLIWALGIVMLIGMFAMAVMAYQQKAIPPQIQSVVMMTTGAFIARIERRKSE